MRHTDVTRKVISEMMSGEKDYLGDYNHHNNKSMEYQLKAAESPDHSDHFTKLANIHDDIATSLLKLVHN